MTTASAPSGIGAPVKIRPQVWGSTVTLAAVPAGTSVILGRDPAQSLVAAAFAQYDNVSRKHATVVVDDGGRATIRDEGTTNGTFVNNERVMPYTEVRLVDGDQIRLAADVTGDVSLPRGEPDPANLSRNGFV